MEFCGGHVGRVPLPALRDWRAFCPRVISPARTENKPASTQHTPRIVLLVNGKRESFALNDEMFWDWIFEKEELPEERVRYEPVNAGLGWSDTVV